MDAGSEESSGQRSHSRESKVKAKDAVARKQRLGGPSATEQHHLRCRYTGTI